MFVFVLFLENCSKLFEEPKEKFPLAIACSYTCFYVRCKWIFKSCFLMEWNLGNRSGFCGRFSHTSLNSFSKSFSSFFRWCACLLAYFWFISSIHDFICIYQSDLCTNKVGCSVCHFVERVVGRFFMFFTCKIMMLWWDSMLGLVDWLVGFISLLM